MFYKLFLISLFLMQSTVQSVYVKRTPISAEEAAEIAEFCNRTTSNYSTRLHEIVEDHLNADDTRDTLKLLHYAHRSGLLVVRSYDNKARTPCMVALEKSNVRLADWFIKNDPEPYAKNERFRIWEKALKGYISSGDIRNLMLLNSDRFKLHSFYDHNGHYQSLDAIQTSFMQQVTNSTVSSKDTAYTLIKNATEQTVLEKFKGLFIC